MTIFVVTRVLLLPDSQRLRDPGVTEGVSVYYQEGEGLIPVWPILPLHEARQARRAIVGSIRSSAGPAVEPASSPRGAGHRLP